MPTAKNIKIIPDSKIKICRNNTDETKAVRKRMNGEKIATKVEKCQYKKITKMYFRQTELSKKCIIMVQIAVWILKRRYHE